LSQPFPHGLLTRAWLRYLSGDEAGSQADLDEAWEIAEEARRSSVERRTLTERRGGARPYMG
jgi:hypothetical protein